MPSLEEVRDQFGAVLTPLVKSVDSIADRVRGLEDRASKSTLGAGVELGENKSLGQTIAESPQVKSFFENRLRDSGRVCVGSFFDKKATIVSDGSLFSLPTRVPNIQAAYVPLRVRDLLRVTQVSAGNSVEFVREVAESTQNNAAPQGHNSSPFTREAVAKAESSIGAALVNQPIETIATWIAASKQVIDDSASLARFIDSRLRYFVKSQEEAQLLTGTGANGDLLGLYTAAVSYTPASYSPTDAVRAAIGEVESSGGYTVTAIVLNSADWTAMEISKASGGSEEYLLSSPRLSGPPQLWGRPVILSSAMAAGTFLVGDFAAAAELFDREQAMVSISREHADYFTRNMVAILAEERLALCIYAPSGFRKGTFSTGSPS